MKERKVINHSIHTISNEQTWDSHNVINRCSIRQVHYNLSLLRSIITYAALVKGHHYNYSKTRFLCQSLNHPRGDTSGLGPYLRIFIVQFIEQYIQQQLTVKHWFHLLEYTTQHKINRDSRCPWHITYILHTFDP